MQLLVIYYSVKWHFHYFQEYDTENYSYDDYPTLDSENDVDWDDYRDEDSYN